MSEEGPVRTGRRIVLGGPGTPLECRAVEVPDPPPGSLLVRTTLAGVCGSDAHRLDGDMPWPGHPIAFGHEGIGVVEALGDGLVADWGGSPVHVGDTVYWQPGSGWWCPHGPAGMSWPPPADVPSVAAYQEYAHVSPGDVFYRVPEDLPVDRLVAFGCAMPTAVGGWARLGTIEPGQVVVVQGCGPVGLAATVLAGLSPASHVVVIGAPDNRLEAARRLGATAVVALEGTTQEERRIAVLDATGGRDADVVIEACGRKVAVAEGMALLGQGGRYLVLGLYSGHGTVEIDPFRLNNLDQRIIGSLGASRPSDYLAVIRLAQRFGGPLGFADLITHRFGLADTEAAIQATRSGTAIKAVVDTRAG